MIPSSPNHTNTQFPVYSHHTCGKKGIYLFATERVCYPEAYPNTETNDVPWMTHTLLRLGVGSCSYGVHFESRKKIDSRESAYKNVGSVSLLDHEKPHRHRSRRYGSAPLATRHRDRRKSFAFLPWYNRKIVFGIFLVRDYRVPFFCDIPYPGCHRIKYGHPSITRTSIPARPMNYAMISVHVIHRITYLETQVASPAASHTEMRADAITRIIEMLWKLDFSSVVIDNQDAIKSNFVSLAEYASIEVLFLLMYVLKYTATNNIYFLQCLNRKFQDYIHSLDLPLLYKVYSADHIDPQVLLNTTERFIKRLSLEINLKKRSIPNEGHIKKPRIYEPATNKRSRDPPYQQAHGVTTALDDIEKRIKLLHY